MLALLYSALKGYASRKITAIKILPYTTMDHECSAKSCKLSSDAWHTSDVIMF